MLVLMLPLIDAEFFVGFRERVSESHFREISVMICDYYVSLNE